jgi:hypothetical protein
MTREGRWGELGTLVPDELLRKVVVCGEPDEVGETLKARYGPVADRLGFYSPGQVISADSLRRITTAAKA